MPTHAIVHSTVSCMLRRVVTDDDGQVAVGRAPGGDPAVICTHKGRPPTYVAIMPGESAFVVRTYGPNDATTPENWAAEIKKATGKDPPDLRCALIEGNLVTGVIAADIAIDLPPDARLMVECYSPLISVGYTYDTATQLFSTPAAVLPPHTPGNSTNKPIAVPPSVIPRP